MEGESKRPLSSGIARNQAPKNGRTYPHPITLLTSINRHLYIENIALMSCLFTQLHAFYIYEFIPVYKIRHMQLLTLSKPVLEYVITILRIIALLLIHRLA